MVVKTFMDMDQDSEEEKELYLNLALHLASDFFLKHPDKDVRLLVACCLADIFRIYAPEAPYTSPDKLKVGQPPRSVCNRLVNELHRSVSANIKQCYRQSLLGPSERLGLTEDVRVSEPFTVQRISAQCKGSLLMNPHGQDKTCAILEP